MPSNKRRGRRSRGRGSSAGSITLQYAAADNVAAYTTINVTTSSLSFPTDRPSRINWVSVEFSCTPDGSPDNKTHVPLLQFEVKAPSGNPTPRTLYRTRPFLVPLGPVIRRRFRIPNAGFFLYDAPNTVVLTAIVSASSNLAVTFSVFVNITMDFKSYQGLAIMPPGSGIHQLMSQHDSLSSTFSRISISGGNESLQG